MPLSVARRVLVVLTVLAVSGALTAAVAAPRRPAVAAPRHSATAVVRRPAVTRYATAWRGKAPRVARHPVAAVSGHPSRHPRGERPIPRLRTRAGAGITTAPSAAPSSGGTATGLTRNFNGVSSLDSRNTNFNAEFEPPDQGLCAGNGYVLEAVNSAYRIYRSNGTTARGPFNVNDLFNEGAAEFTSDPRCYFDPTTDRWFASVLFINFNTGATRADLAVSTSGDPTGFWNQYHIDTTDDGRLGEPNDRGCPCLGDQPLLGIDQHNVYISTNEFSVFGPQFNGAQIYAVAKRDLLRGRAHAHFVHFGHLRIGGARAASVQPASSRAGAPAEFFLSSLDPNGTFDSRLGVWAMTGRAKVAAGGTPTLSSTVIASETYGSPPPAAQKGSTTTLDSGDDRMQQAQYIGGRLWGALGTAITIPRDSKERAGAAWFSIAPTVRAGVVSRARVDRQGYVARKGDFVLYPAVQANAAGQAAMVFTLTGRRNFPSAAYATLHARGTAFTAPRVGAAGTGPYSRTSSRWGDYSYATLNPTGRSAWLATEYIPPKSSQTPDGRQNWGTRVLKVPLR